MPPKDTHSPKPKVNYTVGGIAEQNIGNGRSGRPYPTINYAVGGVAQQNISGNRPRQAGVTVVDFASTPGRRQSKVTVRGTDGVAVVQGSSVKIVTNNFAADPASNVVEEETDSTTDEDDDVVPAVFNNIIGSTTGAVLNGFDDVTITNNFGTGQSSSSVKVGRNSISITKHFP